MSDKMNSIEKAIERLMRKRVEGVGNKKIVSHAEQTPVIVGNKSENQENIAANHNNTILHFDLGTLRELGYVTPTLADKELAEQLRLIKRPLITNAFGRGAAPVEHGNLIMVTSSLPDEGKTFITLNCALSMVNEKNTTVMLVDSDVVNPSLSRMLGVEDRPGLIDVLKDKECDIADVLLTTDIPGLKFLPAGHLDENSTELLASEAMHKLAQELSDRYSNRIVIFDSSPLLVTSQAVVLSEYMGQIVVVVEACKTSQSVLKEAVQLLGNCDVVSLVLNKTRSSSVGGYYYGNYYGNYYGAYGAATKKAD